MTVIAISSLKESLRDRVLWVLAVFAVLLIGASVFLGSISLDQDSRIIIDLGLTGIFLFGVIMTIFMGTATVVKELDQRTAYTILTRPLKRWWYLLGKFVGLCLTQLLLIVLMTIIFMLVVGFRAGWHTIDLSLIIAIIYIFFELAVLIALSLFFSSFTSSIMSAVYALAVFLIGHSSASLATLTSTFASWARYIFVAIYYIFPNLQKFNLRNDVVYHLTPPLNQVGLTFLYAVLYCTVLLYLAHLIFRKQEL